MATDLYTQGLIFVDGILAADCTEFSVDYDTQNNPVFTIAKGFAGITPGAGQTKVSISTAVPRAGYEIDYFKRALDNTPVEFIGWRGSSKYSFKGFLLTIGEKHGVNSASTASIEAICGRPETA